MSTNYAEGLSAYENKGRLGQPEKFDSPSVVEAKVTELAKLVKNARHIVVHTGAGISTSAGIPDFRGPKGVWTLEKKGEKPNVNISWDDARPTVTHMALTKLVDVDKVKFIVSQNIDGLHLRSGVPRNKISELHGNMFVDLCDKCMMMFVRGSAATTVGQITLGETCKNTRGGGRACRGKLHDFVLDWEHALPDDDLQLSESHSMMADLSIVLGSTLQIVPSGKLPTYSKKYQVDGKLVICNLQPTKYDKQAVLVIHTYVDDVMKGLMQKLGCEIPEFDPEKDPVRLTRSGNTPEVGYFDWTVSTEDAKRMKKKSDKIASDLSLRKKEEQKARQEKEKWKRKSEAMYGSVIDLNDSKKVKLEEEDDDIKVCKIVNKAPPQLLKEEETKEETKSCNTDSSDDDVTIVQEVPLSPIKFLSPVRSISDDDDSMDNKDMTKLMDSRAVNGSCEELSKNLHTREISAVNLNRSEIQIVEKLSTSETPILEKLSTSELSMGENLSKSEMVGKLSTNETPIVQKLGTSEIPGTENFAF